MVAQGTEAEASICNCNGLYHTVLDQGLTRILGRGVGQATTKCIIPTLSLHIPGVW